MHISQETIGAVKAAEDEQNAKIHARWKIENYEPPLHEVYAVYNILKDCGMQYTNDVMLVAKQVLIAAKKASFVAEE